MSRCRGARPRMWRVIAASRSASPAAAASTATGCPRAREMVEGGPIDVLTGDYLAELTLHDPLPATG